MRITTIRPEPPGLGKTVARFDVQLTDGLRLYGLRLVRMDSGQLMTFAPKSGGMHSATFGRELAAKITAAAHAALTQAESQHEEYNRAA